MNISSAADKNTCGSWMISPPGVAGGDSIAASQRAYDFEKSLDTQLGYD